jgi:hypothetical protein
MTRWIAHPKNRAQGIVEFALSLPILLLLLFGIFEFGRLVQAWMSIQNSARFGIRYAVTGEFDPTYCQAAANALGLVDADTFGTNPPAFDCQVPRQYCESLPDPDSCDHNLMTSDLEDWARLPSTRDSARHGAAGSAINDDPSVSGDYLTYLLTHDLFHLGDAELTGYYHVTLCSNRDLEVNGFNGSDFAREPDTNPETCVRLTDNTYMDDAGGPGDRVRVTITYDHPMILPLISSIWPKVPLVAWREGIVEQFRVSRISGVGGQIILVPSETPTPTSSPTHTFTPLPPTATDTPVPPTPTNTPTPTETPTPTMTPTPSCSDLEITGPLYFDGDNLSIPLANNSSVYPATITSISTLWDEQENQTLGPWHDEVDALPTDQYFDRYEWNGSTILDVSPNVYLNASGVNYSHSLSLNINPATSGLLGEDFYRSFTSYYVYYHARDYEVTLSYTIGSLVCPAVLVTGLYGPTVEITPQPPNPITQPFYIRANASDPDGTINRVRFEVWDATETNILGYNNDTAAPYCLFGDSGGNCLTRSLGNYWPNSTNVISNGTYVIYVQARDNDTPRQYTRIRQTIVLNLPVLVPCNNTGTGLLGSYYTWTGSSPPNFATITNLVHARIDQQVNFDWADGSPAPGVPVDKFAVRWRGQVQPKYDHAETYTFYMRTDDGVRLWVNGLLVVDRWRDQSATERSGNVAIPAGCPRLDIVIEYYDNTGSAVSELRWSALSIAKEFIPRINLYPPDEPLPPTSVPTATPLASATPTATQTRTPKPTATNTTAPTNTTVPPTATKTSTQPPPAATKTPTRTPTPGAPTATRTPTITPTPCLTPPDLGGCR